MNRLTVGKRIGLGLLLAWWIIPAAVGQIRQTARFERPHKSSDHEYIIQAMGKNGIVLVRDVEKYEKGKKQWDVIVVDSALQTTWETNVYIDNRMTIIGHEYWDGNVYLIFQQTESSRELFLVELDPRRQLYRTHSFKPEANLRFTQFTVIASRIVFGGYLQNEPTMILFDLEKDVAKVIPGSFQAKVELLDIRTNVNNTFNVLMKERAANGSKNLRIHTYDADGVLLVEDVITIDDDKNILEAATSSLVSEDLVILGTWTYGAGTVASGIFSVRVDPSIDQKINYYWLTDLDHFLDYQKPKRASRIKTKAEWRKKNNKTAEFRVHLAPVRIAETPEGYFLLSEAFDPPPGQQNMRSNYYGYGYPNYGTGYGPYSYSPYYFNTMPNRYYYPSGSTYYPYPSNSQYYQTRVYQTSLVFFDLKGNLKFDRAMKFKDIHMMNKEQVTDFIANDNQLTLACKNGKDILLEWAKKDASEQGEEKLSTIQNDTEVNRSESQDDSGVRAWYGNYFYVYGYHTVKDQRENKSRDVFYINKIAVK